MDELTYAKAGVDIDEEERIVNEILKGIGFKKDRVEINGFKIVLCTDGVGSKVMVANEMKKWDTVGIDCIAMNVNDALVMGARPVAFVDYVAFEKLNVEIAREIARGLKRGADEANISIIGGETASLPEIIRGFDLAGTCVGIVEKDIPKEVKEGDVIIGIRSSGIHSNGYTLARKVFKENGYSFHDEIDEIGIIGHALLEPTKIYVRPIVALWKNFEIKGIAHITGGGLRKMRRISKNALLSIDQPFEPQPIFKIIQKLGKISDREMYQTFNMGMGMALAVEKEIADDVVDFLNKYEETKIVGKVKKGNGIEVPKLGLRY
ncbi:MAG: phosphoribosylformylglycinamidine cyclo-ligase [Thermoplasmatales archaeon]|nr:phosphoribosylformylglycinamidine cyclo-ligase [Thermoplasmatales archaeon]